MSLPDETRPKSPFTGREAAHPAAQKPDTEPHLPRLIAPDPEPSGPGCLLTGLVGLVMLVMALLIVGLSAAAGWTSGQRIAQANATATHQTDIDTQLAQIARDAQSGNAEMYGIRLRFLAQQTPAVPQMAELVLTGTALHVASQPTATPTPELTATPTAAATLDDTPAASPSPASPDATPDPFNLPGRLANARRAVSAADWPTAIDELDIILRADPNFEAGAARQLMREALNRQALRLYQTGDPSNLAEANALVDRAQQQFGPLLIETLAFERDVATLYLNAVSAIGTSDFSRAIRNLEEVRRLAAPSYLNGEPTRQLGRVYAAFADGLLLSQPCNAVIQYDNALRIANDPQVAGRRATAQNYCDFGTPTPPGFVPPADPANGENPPPAN